MLGLLGYLILGVLFSYIVCRLDGTAVARSFFAEKRRYQQQQSKRQDQDKEG